MLTFLLLQLFSSVSSASVKITEAEIKACAIETEWLCSSFTENLADKNGNYRPAHRYSSHLNDICRSSDFIQMEKLGSGGFGQVHRAVHRPTGIHVAMKTISMRTSKESTIYPSKNRSSGTTSSRYAYILSVTRAEACLHAQIQHPAVPQFYCSYQNDAGEAVLVMELLKGHKLVDLVYPELKSPQHLSRKASSAPGRLIKTSRIDTSDSEESVSMSSSSASSEFAETIETNQNVEKSDDDEASVPQIPANNNPEKSPKSAGSSASWSSTSDSDEPYVVITDDIEMKADAPILSVIEEELIDKLSVLLDEVEAEEAKTGIVPDVLPIIIEPKPEPFKYPMRKYEQSLRKWTAQLVHVIAYLHSLNIIYGDVKLENIMIDTKGNLRLLDFGLAVTWAGASDLDAGLSGTLMYMSPEHLQSDGECRLPVNDWYAVGIIFYELLYHRDPYQDVIDDKLPNSELFRLYTHYTRTLPIQPYAPSRFPDLENLITELTAPDYRSRSGFIDRLNDDCEAGRPCTDISAHMEELHSILLHRWFSGIEVDTIYAWYN